MAAVKGKQLENVTCPICKSFSSKRITMLERHVTEVHSKTLQNVWDDLHGGPTKCQCGCGEPTKWQGWKVGYAKFVIGHNANLSRVYDEEKAKEIVDKRRAKLIGRPGWAKGKTKENDETIAKRAEATSRGRKRAFDEGKIVAWNAGATKETDPRIAAAGQALAQRYADGELTQWAKGLTENVDARLKKKNDELRVRFASGEIVPWHKGKTVADDPRIKKIWDSRNPKLEYEHIRWSRNDIAMQLADNKHLTLQNIGDYTNDKTPSLDVKCTNCGWSNTVTLIFARNDRCPKCSPTGSKIQNEIADWIESTMNVDVGRNVSGIIGRSELDIYVPMHSFAIEVNGLYWHNEIAGKDKTYHQNKTTMCNALKIQLMHVFEDEWYNKREIVESMIAFKLGNVKQRVHARECKIVCLSSAQKRKFFDANHIDGDTLSSRAFGLVHNDEIVCALSVRRPTHKKHNNTLEIARCCSKINTNIPGGVSKLVVHAAQHATELGCKKLLTYVDTRLGGDGKGYVIAGFTLTGTTSPRFWWTDGHKRFNRFKYRADKPHGLTEAQVAEEAGVTKIWGCSNLVYEMQLVIAHPTLS